MCYCFLVIDCVVISVILFHLLYCDVDLRKLGPYDLRFYILLCFDLVVSLNVLVLFVYMMLFDLIFICYIWIWDFSTGFFRNVKLGLIYVCELQGGCRREGFEPLIWNKWWILWYALHRCEVFQYLYIGDSVYLLVKSFIHVDKGEFTFS